MTGNAKASRSKPRCNTTTDTLKICFRLCQQYPHHRRRHAFERVPVGVDARRQQLRQDKNLLKNEIAITGDDTREGLTAVISVKVPNPQFEGQTKGKLGNSEVEGLVASATLEALGAFFEENPSVANQIINKVITASRAREAARKRVN